MAIKRFKKDTPAYFDYKDAKTLLRYIDPYGKIEPIGKTGLSVKTAAPASNSYQARSPFGTF